jgi:hypothetical protein
MQILESENIMSAISRIRWRINESKQAAVDTNEDSTQPSINVATPYALPHIRLGSPSDKLPFINDIQQQKGYFSGQQNDVCFARFATELQDFLLRSAEQQEWYEPQTKPEISNKVSHSIINHCGYALMVSRFASSGLYIINIIQRITD